MQLCYSGEGLLTGVLLVSKMPRRCHALYTAATIQSVGGHIDVDLPHVISKLIEICLLISVLVILLIDWHTMSI